MKDDHRSYIRKFCSAKRKPDKNPGLYGIRTLDLCDFLTFKTEMTRTRERELFKPFNF